jgi:predicted nucleic acid-binding protein
MKRLSLYLDTSIWNFYFAKDAPVEMKHTIDFFHEAKKGKYDLFISPLVFDEILYAPEPKKNNLLQLIKCFKIVNLEITEEVKGLANKYLSNKIMSEKYEDDAVHIALAVVSRIDLIVSWNF